MSTVALRDFPPGQRDGTEGTLVVAAVLHFEEGAGAVAEAETGDELVGLPHFSGSDEPLPAPRGDSVNVVEDSELFGGAQYEIDPVDIRDFVGLQLGVATDHHHLCTRVSAQRAANDVSALTVGEFSYRAGVDDDDIGAVAKRNGLVTGVGELAADGGGLAVIELAAERVEGDGTEGQVFELRVARIEWAAKIREDSSCEYRAYEARLSHSQLDTRNSILATRFSPPNRLHRVQPRRLPCRVGTEDYADEDSDNANNCQRRQ